MTYQEWDTDCRIKDLETRLKKCEDFIDEIQSGKRVLLWLCVSIAGIIATIYYATSIYKDVHG